MALFTSKANGNWASSGQTTWTQVGVPGAGDGASITHNVTVSADTIIGDGTASGVLTVGSGGAGSLTINASKLTIRGNATIGAVSYPGSIKDFLIITPSGSTQGGIELDGNTGVTPTVTTARGTRIVASGTPSARCYIRTLSSTAGSNGKFTNGGNNFDSGFWLAMYTDFTKLGATGTPGILVSSINGDTGVAGKMFNFDNCLFDGCGQMPKVVIQTDGTCVVSFTSCTWQNSLETLTTGCMNINYSSTAIAGAGVRLFNNCIFLNRPVLDGPRDFNFTNCYFDNTISTIANKLPWTSMDGCFVQTSQDGEIVSGGGISNTYMYALSGVAVNHVFLATEYGNNTTGGANGLGGNHFNNICEWTGTSNLMAMYEETEASPPSTDRPSVFTGNICFSSGSGSIQLLVPNSNTSQAFKNLTTIEHNTVICNGQNATEGATSTGILANSILSIRANIFYNVGSSVGVYAFKNTDTSTAKLNAVPASGITNNCWLGFAASPAGHFSGVSGDTGVEDGTVYSSPMNGAVAPGANDLPNTNPVFADTTRNLAKWDLFLGGIGAATGAISRIKSNTSLVKSSLLPYVRNGYIPTNTSLRAASYVGDTSTIDANGVSWPGGSAGIGAMGVSGVVASSFRIYSAIGSSFIVGPINVCV